MTEDSGDDLTQTNDLMDEDEATIELPEEEAFWSDIKGNEPLPAHELLELVNQQAAILIAVSTSLDAKAADYNAKYKRAGKKLNAALRSKGIAPPFPYDDLFEWHGRWSAGGLPSYHSRRQHIEDLAQPTRNALSGMQLTDPGSSGRMTWSNVDDNIEAVTAKLRAASSREDFKDVGRRCRDILIEAASLLADPSMVARDSEPPRSADAKQWLEIILDSKTRGRSRKRLRALMRPAWELAQRVTHDGDRVETYAAAQATVLIVRTLQLLP